MVDALAPLDGPAAWRGPALARSDGWIHHLSANELAALDRALGLACATGKPRLALTAEDAPLGALAPTVRAWRETLARGRGFLLVRGLPVHAHPG